MKKAEFIRQRRESWEKIARHPRIGKGTFSRFYHKRLQEIYRSKIPPGMKVLEIGCGHGDLLASVRPADGVGVDFVAGMIQHAKLAYKDRPELRFIHAEAGEISAYCPETFDYIILSDLLNDVWDVQEVFDEIKRLSHKSSRVIINIYSHLWELPLFVAQKLGLATLTLEQNWLTVEDISSLLGLSGWEPLDTWTEFLFPADLPVVAKVANAILAKIRPFSIFSLCNFLIARPRPVMEKKESSPPPSVSIIVPARNESGNIPGMLDRIPTMGKAPEIIFVEGNSKDDTIDAIKKEIQRHPLVDCSLHFQEGKGKWDAVRLGFDLAKNDILMIFDADLTVVPEDLPKFYDALVTGKGDFINGVRLVYPMEKQAMAFFNLVGNKFFSLGFSWVMGQPIKDTLCGTKVMWRKEYERLAANRSYFGDFDPFGDFDLLFGAAKLNLKIIDLPIRYGERTYGETNIERWKHGWMLLQMLFVGARRLKFV